MSRCTINRDLAIIGFSSLASPLEPAWPSTHRALLPIAGKPVIIYLIEQLAAAGIKHLRIAGSIQQYAVKYRLGNGEEWGVTIRYSDLHGSDLLLQTLLERGQCLYFQGDEFLNVVRAIHNVEASYPAPALLSDPESAAFWILDKDGPRRTEFRKQDNKRLAALRTTADFHEANQFLTSQKVEEFELPGREISASVQVGWDTAIHPTAQIEPGVSIGNQCFIGKGAYLGPGCVVGDGCVISPHARLANVSVLPNCFVGSPVKLRDAVITPKAIFDLAGNYWLIEDTSLLTRVRSNDESKTGLPAEKFSELERASSASAKV